MIGQKKVYARFLLQNSGFQELVTWGLYGHQLGYCVKRQIRTHSDPKRPAKKKSSGERELHAPQVSSTISSGGLAASATAAAAAAQEVPTRSKVFVL